MADKRRTLAPHPNFDIAARMGERAENLIEEVIVGRMGRPAFSRDEPIPAGDVNANPPAHLSTSPHAGGPTDPQAHPDAHPPAHTSAGPPPSSRVDSSAALPTSLPAVQYADQTVAPPDNPPVTTPAGMQSNTRASRQAAEPAYPAATPTARRPGRPPKQNNNQNAATAPPTALTAPDTSGSPSPAQIRAVKLISTLKGDVTDTVSFRCPRELNDYVERWQFEHKREGIKKQDLLIRAIKLLIVELESGEELAQFN